VPPAKETEEGRHPHLHNLLRLPTGTRTGHGAGYESCKLRLCPSGVPALCGGPCGG
jgi:hypothetical protein